MALLPVEEALARILKDVKPSAAEAVPLAEAAGRVLAETLKARRDQPPFAASAMDGYAVRAEDVAQALVRLKTIGMSAAGHAFMGTLKAGKAVRIFTGAPLPRGADSVVIQENAKAEEGFVTVNQASRQGQNVRGRGLDFKAGETLLAPGIRLNARDIGLAAAMNCATVRVRRKPVVAVIATGDELVLPGERPRADQIFSSNSHALTAMAEHFGARVLNLGIVADSLKATERAIARAAAADILLTSGGASVGDHDFVQEALERSGVKLDFWKIAMRPGKPFMYGRRGRQRVMGLPGNPVSALVCAMLFLKPLLDALLGLPVETEPMRARLGAPMRANDSRQDYIRATLRQTPDGARIATPHVMQDSSMQRMLRESHCLIVRPPMAPAAAEGHSVLILPLDF